MLIICKLFVCLSPTRSCRPLADGPSSAIVLVAMSGCSSAGPHGPRVSQMSPPCEKLHPPQEIYASGGGLLVAPTNAPHVLFRHLSGGGYARGVDSPMFRLYCNCTLRAQVCERRGRI